MKRGSLLAGVAVLIVAIAIAVMNTRTSVDSRPYAVLRADLKGMREAIKGYRAKHQHNPTSLNDLVTDGELRAIPADPITKSKTTWKVTVEETVAVDDFQPGSAKRAPSIVDVHSGASGSDSSGRPFSDY